MGLGADCWDGQHEACHHNYVVYFQSITSHDGQAKFSGFNAPYTYIKRRNSPPG